MAEEPTIIASERDLYMRVGEIHADVRTLLQRDEDKSKRISDLEKSVAHRTYLGAGALLFLAAIVDPKQWTMWLDLIKKGILF